MNENKIIVRVVECTDIDEVYGALAIGWTIEDLMEQLNKIYPDVEWLNNYELHNYIEV